MKVLQSWLAEYLDLPAAGLLETGVSEQIAEHLTSLGLAVEEMIGVGHTVDGVITAKVLRTESHVDAAKVHRVFVDAGDGVERHVWCGAFNMSVGDVVPLATLGTEMPDGRRIERRGILGIDSEGMLCSASELGLGTDHSGIMLLDPSTPLGVPYGEALGVRPDVIFDLDLTRNRPDCWGYVGVARDLAARLGVEFRPPRTARALPASDPARAGVSVEIRDPERCGRFLAIVISGITVGPSAPWMAQRLTAAGMRPINNVVDVSNYVMLELNQPNHAYDLHHLGGSGFIIRTATEGERLTTLDGVERSVTPADLLICDAMNTPVGIAGIMGGLDSEISDSTTSIALEMAWFQAGPILASATRLGLRSEASARFERGVDPWGIDLAVNRFIDLLAETCPGLEVQSAVSDIHTPILPAAQREVLVRIDRVNGLLGTALDIDMVRSLLVPIGFACQIETAPSDSTGGVLSAKVPSWRPDCEGEVDLIEEVARHHGYHRIAKAVPLSPVHGHLSVAQTRRRHLRQVLLGLGISEAMPNPFLGPETAAAAGVTLPMMRITNPLVSDESVLRTSLRPGLLRAIAFNESHRRDGAHLYEIGHVYPAGTSELPDETEMLCVVLAGSQAPAAVALWREVSAALGIGARLDHDNPPSGMHRTRSASLVAGKSRIGAIGEIDPAVTEASNISERVAVLELDLSAVLETAPTPAKWAPVSRAPSSDLDLAFVLAEEVPAQRIDRAIRQGAGSMVVSVTLFDVFRGGSLETGTRSLAYRVRLQAPDRTLTEADISKRRAAIIAAVAKAGGVLRS
jgi:phenylalanyl-tRNA synthetase beta chain